MTNPYAPPRAEVLDIIDPHASITPAERGTRLGAAILDGFIFGMMVYVPLIVSASLGAIAVRTANPDRVNTIVAASFILPLLGLVTWAWLTIKFMRANGQSIGKKTLGIRVVRRDGSPASLARLVWLRNVLNVILSFIPLYGIVDSLFIFGESRQCLHDKLADTIVIKA